MKRDIAQEITSEVARLLAQARGGKGLSKNKLAKLSRLDPRAIAMIEKEERTPSIYTVLKITQALDMNLSELLKEAEKNID